jgi:hypothetical protein
VQIKELDETTTLNAGDKFIIQKVSDDVEYTTWGFIDDEIDPDVVDSARKADTAYYVLFDSIVELPSWLDSTHLDTTYVNVDSDTVTGVIVFNDTTIHNFINLNDSTISKIYQGVILDSTAIVGVVVDSSTVAEYAMNSAEISFGDTISDNPTITPYILSSQQVDIRYYDGGEGNAPYFTMKATDDAGNYVVAGVSANTGSKERFFIDTYNGMTSGTAFSVDTGETNFYQKILINENNIEEIDTLVFDDPEDTEDLLLFQHETGEIRLYADILDKFLEFDVQNDAIYTSGTELNIGINETTDILTVKEGAVSFNNSDIEDVDSITANRFVGTADSAADAGAFQGISTTTNLATDPVYIDQPTWDTAAGNYANVDVIVNDTIYWGSTEWYITLDGSDNLTFYDATFGGVIMTINTAGGIQWPLADTSAVANKVIGTQVFNDADSIMYIYGGDSAWHSLW